MLFLLDNFIFAVDLGKQTLVFSLHMIEAGVSKGAGQHKTTQTLVCGASP